jgi:hypothetical protein
MTGTLHDLRERMTRRWDQWRALRWCANLATLATTQLEAELLRGPPTDADSSCDHIEEAVDAALDGLASDARPLLSLLLDGSTTSEIATDCGISKAQALQRTKALLCSLADNV